MHPRDAVYPRAGGGTEVWMTYYDNGEFRMRYVKAWDDRRGGMSIVTERKDGSLEFYNFIRGRTGSLNAWREGVLLFGG